jgi:hypothetical protein
MMKKMIPVPYVLVFLHACTRLCVSLTECYICPHAHSNILREILIYTTKKSNNERKYSLRYYLATKF